MADSAKLAYFVHDVTDAAVLRRVEMFRQGGADVVVLGFRRRGPAQSTIGGAPLVDLGTTGDAQLARRVFSVMAVLLRPGKVRAALRDRPVIVARNLETLVIARVLGGRRRIVFECLDIHRLLVGTGLASRLLQAVERWALRGVALLVVSSPRFVTDHFAVRHRTLPEVLLVENRLLDLDDPPTAPARRASGRTAPWVIGWFGMLRCSRSLSLLEDIVARAKGRVRVVIAGIASPAVFDDFLARVAAVAGLEFKGRYAAGDLDDLYRQVDFAWAIDYFEEGLNSTWLLPNRLYESIAHGAVPIALAGTETAAWLARNGVGVVIDDPARLAERLADIDEVKLATLSHAVAQVPASVTRAGREDCRALVRAVAGC